MTGVLTGHMCPYTTGVLIGAGHMCPYVTGVLIGAGHMCPYMTDAVSYTHLTLPTTAEV